MNALDAFNAEAEATLRRIADVKRTVDAATDVLVGVRDRLRDKVPPCAAKQHEFEAGRCLACGGSECPTCHGTGEVGFDDLNYADCPACDGDGAEL